MSASDVMNTLKQEGVRFVALRFTDSRGKEQHVTLPASALDEEGIPAADVGEVVSGQGVFVDGDFVEHPGVDPFWGAFEAWMGKLEAAADD